MAQFLDGKAPKMSLEERVDHSGFHSRFAKSIYLSPSAAIPGHPSEVLDMFKDFEYFYLKIMPLKFLVVLIYYTTRKYESLSERRGI
jgi:hypothetical protein